MAAALAYGLGGLFVFVVGLAAAHLRFEDGEKGVAAGDIGLD